MSEFKKNTDIDSRSREEVHNRDGRRCVYCGRTDKPIELAHFISRARGGKGIPQNLLSLCIDCHQKFDGVYRQKMREYLESYLISAYSGWSEEEITYRKGN